MGHRSCGLISLRQPNVKQYASSARVEELDLEPALGDLPGQADQLVACAGRRRCRAVGVDVARRAAPSGKLPIEEHAERDRGALDAGPITRLTSRAWNWNAIRPPGSFSIAACRATVQFPESVPLVQRRAVGARHRRGACRTRATSSDAKPVLWPYPR